MKPQRHNPAVQRVRARRLLFDLRAHTMLSFLLLIATCVPRPAVARPHVAPLLAPRGALHTPALAPEDTLLEGRALWIVRTSMTTRVSIDSALARAEQIHATDLFVQVRGRGDAYYRSGFVPHGEALRDSAFDPLAYAVDEGHRRGMKVHAWMNVFLLWSSDKRPVSPIHIYNAHPEWCDVDRGGRPLATLTHDQLDRIGAEGTYLAPVDTTVRAHLVAVAREIVAGYDVDGVHLDYVRYPSAQSGYTPAARDEFVRRYHVDPVTIPPADLAMVRAWQSFRAEQVTAFVRGVRAAIDSVRPGTLLSAAVIPDPADAYMRCGQDWPRWLNEGVLDFAAPMCYGTRWSTVDRQVRRSRAAAPKRPIYAGIAVYDQSATNAAQKIVLARAVGVEGIALFSYDAIAARDDYWTYLARNVFAAPTVSPVLPKHSSFDAIDSLIKTAEPTSEPRGK
jgi:uncharacterized lipoprotein YddW (UPF0748 family)